MRFNDMSGTNDVNPDMAPWVGSTLYQYRDWSVPLPTTHYLSHRDIPWSTTRLIGSTLLEPPNNRGHHHEVKLLLSLKYALACTLGELTREMKPLLLCLGRIFLNSSHFSHKILPSFFWIWEARLQERRSTKELPFFPLSLNLGRDSSLFTQRFHN